MRVFVWVCETYVGEFDVQKLDKNKIIKGKVYLISRGLVMHKQEKINAKNKQCFRVFMYDTIIKFKMIRINCEIMK